MLIETIHVSNFKSFQEAGVELGRFNVLIGPNASGKSNFVDIFRFLKDTVESGLDNAMSMQGGAEYLRNIKIGPSRDLSVRLTVDCEDKPGRLLLASSEEEPGFVGLVPQGFAYGFSMEFYKRRRGHKRIRQEGALTRLDVVEFPEGGESIGHATLEVTREGQAIEWSIDVSDQDIRVEDIMPPVSLPSVYTKLPRKELILENRHRFPAVSSVVGEMLGGIAIYDFDPQLPKRAIPVTGKADLEPDGSNLAIVMRDLLEDKDKGQRLYRLVKDMLPFVEEIKVVKLADKSLLATLREVYSGNAFLPAFLVSDGTINVTALIIALFFEHNPVVIVEEPERNIHPHLISKVIDLMKDAAETLGKQIIVTTHNPEVVKHAGVDNILLVQRDEEGFSTISRPSERDQVRTFLQQDLGIEELFVDDLLEW